jgi:hypothetical protein
MKSLCSYLRLFVVFGVIITAIGQQRPLWADLVQYPPRYEQNVLAHPTSEMSAHLKDLETKSG